MSATSYLTNNGRLLLAEMLTGQRLVYTKMISSSEVLDNPILAEEIIEPKQTATELHVEQQAEAAEITALFSCVNLVESYDLRTIGLYAKREGQDEDVLYSVTVFNDEAIIPMIAGLRAEYNISLYDSMANGNTLNITVADAASAPIGHVYNSYRHLFIQTNNNSIEAVVDSGGFTNFHTGQEIVFVPSVDLTAGVTKLVMAGKRFNLLMYDLSNNPIAGTFSQHNSYVLTYRNGSFVHTDTSTFKVIDGVAHYWDSEGWHTLEPAGKIVASCSAIPPAGSLLCDGSQVSVLDYPELYDAIGNTYGGNEEWFRLPSLMDTVVRGVDAEHPVGTARETVLAENEEGFRLRTSCMYYYIYTGKVLL